MSKLDIHGIAGLTRYAISAGIIESTVQLTVRWLSSMGLVKSRTGLIQLLDSSEMIPGAAPSIMRGLPRRDSRSFAASRRQCSRRLSSSLR